MEWWRRLSTLGVAVLAIVAASVEWGRVGSAEAKAGSAMLFAVGLLMLGVWLATDALRRDKNDGNDSQPPRRESDPGS